MWYTRREVGSMMNIAGASFLAFVEQMSPGWLLSPLGLVALVLAVGGVLLMFISFRRHGTSALFAALAALLTALVVFGVVYGLAVLFAQPQV